MIALLLALGLAAPQQDALRYDITLVPADTGSHLLGEVETAWRLGSSDPVAVLLDSSMRVVRVLVDGRPNTRLSRTMYGRSGEDVVVPHQKRAGDSITTRVRYHGLAGGGATSGRQPPAVSGSSSPAGAAAAPGSGSRCPRGPISTVPRPRSGCRRMLAQRAIAPGVLEKIDTLALRPRGVALSDG